MRERVNLEKEKEKMAMDARQVIAAILTLSMFAMLGNMIKKDHFDTFQMKFPATSHVQYDTIKIAEKNIIDLPTIRRGPWKNDSEALKPCWNKPALEEREQSTGFITFSFSNGPEYHVSQLADAVVIARYLGATLVLPDIRKSERGQKRKFEEIYDAKKCVKNLGSVVRVALDQPSQASTGKLTVVRVPNRVSEEYIAAKIEPVFRTKGNLSLSTYFPSLDMRRAEETKYLDSFACLAMFGTLQLQPELQEVVDSMVGRLRNSSRKSNGQFVAVDLRFKVLERECRRREAKGKKNCYNAEEIGVFLKKIGFDRDTAIYLTQSKWHHSLDALREIFPKTFTKEGIMPAEKKAKFLSSESSEFEKAIDFYICSESDVFVPSISGLFYTNVVGKRIASGKSQILVPAQKECRVKMIEGKVVATHRRMVHLQKGLILAYTTICLPRLTWHSSVDAL